MLTLGFNARGTETVFEQMLDRARRECRTNGFYYLENGVAEGTTLASVADWCADHVKVNWHCYGVDLVSGHFFDVARFFRLTRRHEAEVVFNGVKTPFVNGITNNRVTVNLLRDGEQRPLIQPESISFALIDGCHGSPCVEKDFLAIEQGIAPNGIVAFHDAGVEDQDIHFQTHCNMPISVRKALGNLELWPLSTLDETPPMRSGWRFIGSVDGDKSPGNLQDNGHGFAFFQKLPVERIGFSQEFSGERR